MAGKRALAVCFRFFAFFLSNARFPVLPIPQLPLGSVFPETSQRNSAKSLKLRHRLPPTTCARDWAASAARAREWYVHVHARAPLEE